MHTTCKYKGRCVLGRQNLTCDLKLLEKQTYPETQRPFCAIPLFKFHSFSKIKLIDNNVEGMEYELYFLRSPERSCGVTKLSRAVKT